MEVEDYDWRFGVCCIEIVKMISRGWEIVVIEDWIEKGNSWGLRFDDIVVLGLDFLWLDIRRLDLWLCWYVGLGSILCCCWIVIYICCICLVY